MWWYCFGSLISISIVVIPVIVPVRIVSFVLPFDIVIRRVVFVYRPYNIYQSHHWLPIVPLVILVVTIGWSIGMSLVPFDIGSFVDRVVLVVFVCVVRIVRVVVVIFGMLVEHRSFSIVPVPIIPWSYLIPMLHVSIHHRHHSYYWILVVGWVYLDASMLLDDGLSSYGMVNHKWMDEVLWEWS